MSVPRQLRERVDAGLADRISATVRQKVNRALEVRVAAMIAALDGVGPALRSAKEYAIQNLGRLVDEAQANLEANGIKVFRAPTAEEAVAYVAGLVGDGGVVKSKTNAAKEIGLVEALAGRGIPVMETDLGDRICQLGHIPASHPIGPALHVPVEEVARLFAADTGRPVPPVAGEIVAVARETMRERFFQADVGISGANAIAADTGSVIVMENEGNIRSVTSLPRVHVIVAGVEKIVATLEDALKVVQAAALYGMGLDVTTYVSVISGPGPEGVVGDRFLWGRQGPAEVHLVLLEEGRREALAAGFGESLYCINCGGCLARCPVYNELGDRYGYKYFGGIGIIHTAFRNGLTRAREAGLDLCAGCRRCQADCPARIDTPGLITALRQKVVAGEGLDVTKKAILRGLLHNGSLVQKLAPAATRVLGREDDAGGWQPRFSLPGLERARRLPALAGRPFLSGVAGAGPAPTAYFVGCLNNLALVRVARATMRVLERLGPVAVPAGQKCCGYPALVSGDREQAVRCAIANLEAFADAGLKTVVCDCPTCLTGLLSYPQLLSGDSRWADRARELAARVTDLGTYLAAAGIDCRYEGEPLQVTYHQPCHLTARGLFQGRELLAALPGVEFVPLEREAECCGFGGLFSVDFYRLARVIGGRKGETIASSGAGVVVTSCPGCLVQLTDVLPRDGPRVMHLAEVLVRGSGFND